MKHYTVSKEEVIAFIVIICLIATIFYFQMRPVPTGTYTLIPGEDTKGTVHLQSVSPYDFFMQEGKPIRVLNQTGFSLAISVPRKVTSIFLRANVTGNGSLSARSWDDVAKEYNWIPLYQPGWEDDITIREKEEHIVVADPIWKAQNTIKQQDIESVEEWITTVLPEGTGINDPQHLLDWDALQKEPVPTINRTIEVNHSLRGTHKFFIRTSENFTLDVQKLDIGNYAGDDTLEIRLTSQDNDVMIDTLILDQQKATKQRYAARLPNPGVYTLTLTSNSIKDDFMYNFSVTADRLVFEKKLVTNEPTNATIFCQNDCTVKAIASNKRYSQTIFIDEQPIYVETPGKYYPTQLSAGMHTIVIPVGGIKLTGNFIGSFAEETFMNPVSYYPDTEGPITIRTKKVPIALHPDDTFEHTIKMRTDPRNSLLYMRSLEVTIPS